jgi:hypothetical protein
LLCPLISWVTGASLQNCMSCWQRFLSSFLLNQARLKESLELLEHIWLTIVFQLNILLFLWAFFSIENVCTLFTPWYGDNSNHLHLSQKPSVPLQTHGLLMVKNHQILPFS